MNNNNSQRHNKTTHKQNHLLYFCIFNFFFFLCWWICIIGLDGASAAQRYSSLRSANSVDICSIIIPNLIIHYFSSASIFCVSHFSISISHLFLFYFDASKYIGKAFFVSRKKNIIFTWNCPLIRLPSSRSLPHAFGLQLDTCMRMAFANLQCQLEWLLHNFSIHQLESMLTLVCLCIQ